MNKQQIIEQLKRLGEDLSTHTVEKVENNDKVFAVEDIIETIETLNILMYEIRRY